MASVAWARDRLTAGLRVNDVGDMVDTSASKSDDGGDYRVSSYTTFNSCIGIRLGQTHKSYLRFGVNNLFDRDPPLADEDRTYLDEDANPGRFFYADSRFKL